MSDFDFGFAPPENPMDEYGPIDEEDLLKNTIKIEEGDRKDNSLEQKDDNSKKENRTKQKSKKDDKKKVDHSINKKSDKSNNKINNQKNQKKNKNNNKSSDKNNKEVLNKKPLYEQLLEEDDDPKDNNKQEVDKEIIKDDKKINKQDNDKDKNNEKNRDVKHNKDKKDEDKNRSRKNKLKDMLKETTLLEDDQVEEEPQKDEDDSVELNKDDLKDLEDMDRGNVSDDEEEPSGDDTERIDDILKDVSIENRHNKEDNLNTDSNTDREDKSIPSNEEDGKNKKESVSEKDLINKKLQDKNADSKVAEKEGNTLVEKEKYESSIINDVRKQFEEEQRKNKEYVEEEFEKREHKSPPPIENKFLSSLVLSFEELFQNIRFYKMSQTTVYDKTLENGLSLVDIILHFITSMMLGTGVMKLIESYRMFGNLNGKVVSSYKRGMYGFFAFFFIVPILKVLLIGVFGTLINKRRDTEKDVYRDIFYHIIISSYAIIIPAIAFKLFVDINPQIAILIMIPIIYLESSNLRNIINVSEILGVQTSFSVEFLSFITVYFLMLFAIIKYFYL